MGRYELLKRLAVGGMAELYLARQTGVPGFEKVVVVKRVLPHLAESEEFVSMFLNEARIAAGLDHPNIAQVTDSGEAEGEHYFAMEYVHGRTLLEILKKSDVAALPLECAIYVIIGVAAALHQAHEHLGPDGRPYGLVHRDVSPSNVIVSYEGAVKLTDFGIAKAVDRTMVTLEGTLKGKIGYMSPEQCRGEPVDRRSDIFALGILLYEATTAARAFYAPNEFAIMGKIAKVDVAPPSKVEPDYPPALEAIVMRALAKAVEDRYPTAQAMQLELENFVHAQHLRVSAVDLATHMKTLFGTVTHPVTDLRPVVERLDAEGPPIHRRPPTRRLWPIGVGLGVAAAGVVLALRPWESKPAPPPTAVQSQPAPVAATPTPIPVPIPAQAISPEPPPVDKAPPRAKRPKRKKKRRTKAAAQPDRNDMYPPGARP